MNSGIYSWKKVLAQLLLLALPTAVLMWYVIWDVNRYYDILQNHWMIQGTYFLAGITISIIIFSMRLRFLTTTAVIVLLYFILYKQIGRIAKEEFDTFFVAVQFQIFGILFFLGWIAGYGFSRSRIFTVIWPVIILCAQIILISKTTEISAKALITAFMPVVAYAVYIIYTSELIRNLSEDQKGFGWFISKRLFGFALIIGLLVWGVFTFFEKDFTTIEKDWGNNASGKIEHPLSNTEKMFKENKDGSLSTRNETQLTGNLQRGKRLVFVARLDNFFPDGTPNPLYFTSYYYTKFDTLTQTFETDEQMPNNDLFKPNPSKISLYFAKSDSSVIRNTMADKARKVVTAEVYKTLLSPDEYVAPSTAFFCQPLPVDNAFKEQYKSAYRAKMWVSDLNSAYFIYNPAGNNPMLESFQEQRFDALRQVKDFSELDPKFMQYYTFMPHDTDYNRVRTLAQQIAQNAEAPVDKVIAVRDYFLGKDEFGLPLYKYSDNPGIPGMPSANKITYFLFDSKKGYCAYFAGATLFLLRAMGIPSRIAAGFLTVDRSTKNPGWYWFYEDQAHAWVQVYFPEYGWIDFDTTVPDPNTQEAPQPDQTPPLNMTNAHFVADGKVVKVDTVKKRLTLDVTRLLYHDLDYETSRPVRTEIDASIATVSKDTGLVSFSSITDGMHITAASFAESLKEWKASPTDSLASVIKKIVSPVPVDEIKIMDEDKEAKKKEATQHSTKPMNLLKTLYALLIAIGAFLFLIAITPWVIWQFINAKAKKNKPEDKSAYYKYRAALFYLNQLGHPRSTEGPQEYAMKIDQLFDTDFTSFNRVYQKVKYSPVSLSEAELQVVDGFYKPFKKGIREKISWKTRFGKFLNLYNTIHFFAQPKIN